MPALPSSVLEPRWVQVAALLPARRDRHPLGCHRPRIPDRIVFDKLIQILVFGCGYRRIAGREDITDIERRHAMFFRKLVEESAWPSEHQAAWTDRLEIGRASCRERVL